MNQQSSARSSTYQIREIQPSDLSRWDEFVESTPAGTFFHLSGWKKIVETVLHHPAHYLLCESEGLVVGVLPLVQVKSLLFGNALISVPFLVYGGALASEAGAEEALLNAAVDLARTLNVDYLELRNRDQPASEGITKGWQAKTAYVTFRKEIAADPETNLSAVPRKQRAMIRKGIKAGLQANLDTDVDRLYRVLLECKRNLGTPFFACNYLRAILETFGDRVEVLTVTKDKTVVCSVMSFLFRDEILPYYGGGGDLARTLKGNDFMYWSVLERAGQNGVKVFDYGRSMAGTGAYRFKKHWGFDEQPLNYQYYLVMADSVPQLNPSNPKYTFLINRWRQLPLPVAGLIGPRIARCLG